MQHLQPTPLSCYGGNTAHSPGVGMGTTELATETRQDGQDHGGLVSVKVEGCRRKPEVTMFLVIANISKRCNEDPHGFRCGFWGRGVDSRASQVLSGAHPKSLPAYFAAKRFGELSACRDYVHSRGGTLVGVEIGDGAKNVDQEPFSGTCAFMLGNEGSGMSQQQRACCDSFVYISQYGGGTASLNVTVAASIVLHRFAAWSIDMRSSSSSVFPRMSGLVDAVDETVGSGEAGVVRAFLQKGTMATTLLVHDSTIGLAVL